MSKAFKKSGRFCGVRPNATAYILVGGASSRFGSDKAFAEIGGRSLLARLIELLTKSLVLPVYLVGDPAKYGAHGKQCLPDLWPGEGPLGGILTALENARSLPLDATTDYNLIMSCDMPFLNEMWLEELLTKALHSDAQVVVPRSSTGLEPLCAVWHTDALTEVQTAFDVGVRKVTEAMKRLPMEVLDESVWKRFDTEGRLFWNMNTTQDYEEARRVLEQGEQWTKKYDHWAKRFMNLD